MRTWGLTQRCSWGFRSFGNDATRVDRSFLEPLKMSTLRRLETSVPVTHWRSVFVYPRRTEYSCSFPLVRYDVRYVELFVYLMTLPEFAPVYSNLVNDELERCVRKIAWELRSSGCYAACSGGSLPAFRDKLSVPKCGWGITTTRCVIAQKSAYLTYFAAEVWNLARFLGFIEEKSAAEWLEWGHIRETFLTRCSCWYSNGTPPECRCRTLPLHVSGRLIAWCGSVL
jgi:hypothetical protein